MEPAVLESAEKRTLTHWVVGRLVSTKVTWQVGSLLGAASGICTLVLCIFLYAPPDVGIFALAEGTILLCATFAGWGGSALLNTGHSPIKSVEKQQLVSHAIKICLFNISLCAGLSAFLWSLPIPLKYRLFLSLAPVADAMFQIWAQEMRLRNEGKKYLFAQVAVLVLSITFGLMGSLFAVSPILLASIKYFAEFLVIAPWVIRHCLAPTERKMLTQLLRDGGALVTVMGLATYLQNGPRFAFAALAELKSTADFAIAQKMLALSSVGYTVPVAALWVAVKTESFRRNGAAALQSRDLALNALKAAGAILTNVLVALAVFRLTSLHVDYPGGFRTILVVAFVQFVTFGIQTSNLAPYVVGPIYAALLPFGITCLAQYVAVTFRLIPGEQVPFFWAACYFVCLAIVLLQNRKVWFTGSMHQSAGVTS